MARQQLKPRQDSHKLSTDPQGSAQAAGLRYVSDAQPGIQRQRAGRGFRYIGVDGRPIRDAQSLRRFKALVIPPAWTEVWICPRPDGHIQATGRDTRGRKQYRYHPRWRIVRDTTKYDRMIAFGEALPRLRECVERDMARPGLPFEKVLATVVRLLETTLIRIGNSEYARENQSFGLTTMRDRHVKISGPTLQFQFRGKGGKYHTVSLDDRRLANNVKRCQDIPGYALFQYLDETGQRQTIDSADVNAYLRGLTGQDFTAKDMRTWAGTVSAACALWQLEAFESQTQAKINVIHAMDVVARQLGNTRAVCRKCYVHPTIIEAYFDRSLFEVQPVHPKQDIHALLPRLLPEEAVVLTLLKQHETRPDILCREAG
jgi:DNA topoisomerase-1